VCVYFSLPLSSLTNSNSCMLPAVFVLSLCPAVAVSSPVVDRLRHINGKLFATLLVVLIARLEFLLLPTCSVKLCCSP